MELVIERDSFIKSLQKVQGIVEKRNAMPILSNTLLKGDEGRLELVATDLEVTIIDHCPVDLQSSGSVTLNAKKLFEIVRVLPEGPVRLKSGDDFRVEVSAGKSRTEIMGLSPDDYPKIPSSSDFSYAEMPSQLILEMVNKTIYASAGDDARFSLNGIYIEKTEEGALRMVATDGHRLALIDRNNDQAKSMDISSGVIMPRKGMSEVVKLLENKEGAIGIGVKEKMASFRIDDTMVFMRLVDGKFPDYKRVIIEGCDKKAIVNKNELISNLRRVSIMVDEKARAVKFSFKNNQLSLESRNPSFGSSYSEMEIKYEGEDIFMAFNDRYFLDIMNVTTDEEIQIELRDEHSPALVKMAGDPEYTCVVMPMRI